MQLALDVLRFLFFPGLLFLAVCGGALLYLEGRMRAALFGGEAPPLRPAWGGRLEGAAASLGELIVVTLSLAGMGAGGVMLVGRKGDLLSLALLFSAVEVLPFALGGEGGGMEAARLPLLLRTSLLRLTSVLCVVLCVSLRFPGEFAPGLTTFDGEGAFNALQLWSGTEYALVLASLAAAALSVVLLNLGHPLVPRGRGGRDGGPLGGLYPLLARGSERAVFVLFALFVFLGYPWGGWLGSLLWSAAVLAALAFLTAARAWADGRDRVTLRRWQEAGFILAALSLALALAAAG